MAVEPKLDTNLVWKNVYTRLPVNIDFQRLPKTSRDFQRLPKFPKVSQRLPKTSKDFQRHPKNTKDFRRHPKTPKDFQRHPKNSKDFQRSSTACVVLLNAETCHLYTANIGDSGFMVVRRGEVVRRSEEQQHYFNTPFQLSLPPPGYRQEVLSDRPDSAVTEDFPVEDGDVILVATDGVFDNLPHNLIVNELVKVGKNEGFITKQAVDDADSLTIQTAIEMSSSTQITVVGEDVDLLILLIALAPAERNIYFLKPKKGNVLRQNGTVPANYKPILNNRAISFSHIPLGVVIPHHVSLKKESWNASNS
ncbi:unnamed protein product [Phaedon cochleariae]|uniref:Protein phosphatase n=1 Tax=Phaedon cochleariae TaxID=80249 RepID=A0A9N9SJH8_PHACE|nr:unnamed protein product [Phaedon cochleariae]